MPSWVDVHRSRWYSDADRIVRADGLVVATPMRMLWGLAAMCNQHRFDRAAEDAWHLGLITPADRLVVSRRTPVPRKGRGGEDRTMARRRPPDAIAPPRAISSECCSKHWNAAGSQRRSANIRSRIPSGETIHLDIAWPEHPLGVSNPAPRGIHGGDLGQRRDQDRDRECSRASGG